MVKFVCDLCGLEFFKSTDLVEYKIIRANTTLVQKVDCCAVCESLFVNAIATLNFREEKHD